MVEWKNFVEWVREWTFSETAWFDPLKPLFHKHGMYQHLQVRSWPSRVNNRSNINSTYQAEGILIDWNPIWSVREASAYTKYFDKLVSLNSLSLPWLYFLFKARYKESLESSEPNLLQFVSHWFHYWLDDRILSED